ncbi:MAG: methyltransferase domain-containing protein [Phycisphaerae bacterium]
MTARAYGRDLAYVHDAGFGAFARDAGAAVLAMLRKSGIRKGTVVDLGCGSGIWAARLVRAGYVAHGIDISPDMIALARRRTPRATFECVSLLRAALPRCSAVTAMGECLNYRFDRRAGAAAIQGLFRHVYDALEPGGLFVFDAAAPGRASGPPVKLVEGSGWLVLSTTQEGKRTRVLTRRIVTFRRDGGSWRRSDEVHRLRLYKPQEVARWLRAAGFRVRTRRGYVAERLPGEWHVFIAQTPRRRN